MLLYISSLIEKKNLSKVNSNFCCTLLDIFIIIYHKNNKL